jgi:glycosyltransferase involved in cell wall biosynthesis
LAPGDVRWEIVVVNNRCTDDTDAVLEWHARRLPLRRVFEDKQGQSHARNAAAVAARGELIVWTDDDVLVDPQWLTEMLAAAHAHPEFSFFGGPIDPWFEHDPPQWLLDNWQAINGAFAFRNLGTEAFEFDVKRLPYGANYAMRTSVQLPQVTVAAGFPRQRSSISFRPTGSRWITFGASSTELDRPSSSARTPS